MKTIFTIIAVVIACLTLNAQAPQQFKYQAVARDISGNILPDQDVAFRISILEGAVGGTALFVETHNTTTNGYGLISLSVGGGVNVSGSIAAIDWGANIFFLKVEMDPANGTAYVDMGTSQLLSVPYALYAETAENVDNYVETQTLADVLDESNDADGQKIINLSDPEDPQDAVTKEYLRELLNRVETIEKIYGLKIYNDTVTDFEGNKYRVVEIGNQKWMVDNLKATKYADGTDITGLYVYDDDEDNAEKYGRLYTWDAIMNGAGSSSSNPSYVQGTCPDGWHIPSDAEWKEMELYLGMPEDQLDLVIWRGDDQGTQLKAIDPVWDPNSGNNVSGFSALPGGVYIAPDFSGLSTYAYFWSGTESDGTRSYVRVLAGSHSTVFRNYYEKEYGLSVRCVENNYQPVLHNKLGSVAEVESSILGPNGAIVGTVNFDNDVQFGKGVTPNTGSAGSGVDFPTTMLNPEAGCIEMWTKFYTPPASGTHGVYGFVNVAHWTHEPVSFYWHNSSSSFSGTVSFGTINYIVTLTGFAPSLDTPVHIAFVWDRNGIDGTGDYLRLYVDGVVVAANTTDNIWGTNTNGNFRVAAPWDNSFATDRYTVDNIKVWDYAKSDFSDRMTE